MKEIEEKSKEIAEKSEKSDKQMDDMKNNIEKLQDEITSNAKEASDKVNFPHIETLLMLYFSKNSDINLFQINVTIFKFHTVIIDVLYI